MGGGGGGGGEGVYEGYQARHCRLPNCGGNTRLRHRCRSDHVQCGDGKFYFQTPPHPTPSALSVPSSSSLSSVIVFRSGTALRGDGARGVGEGGGGRGRGGGGCENEELMRIG